MAVILRCKPHFMLVFLMITLVLGACSPTKYHDSQRSPPSSLASPLLSPLPPSSIEPVKLYTYKIIKVYPHDPQAFTQGLVFKDGVLYEGTGLYGKSSLRKVDLTSGSVLTYYRLPDKYFGEGITLYKDDLIQLTWQSMVGFVYDRNSFVLLREFSYSTEGWGITQDGRHLIMSDGTSKLYFLDPEILKQTGDIDVRYQEKSLKNINELEYINGKIYANIWLTDNIAIIDPGDGRVTGWIDLSGLLQTQIYNGAVDVLNGIAYDSEGNRLFVTGKLWPYLFQIELVEKKS